MNSTDRSPDRYPILTDKPLDIERRADASMLVRLHEPLGEYPLRVTDRLLSHAAAQPERTLIARRDAHGQWQRISYGAMLDRVRRVGQALLARGLSAEHPVVVLSENDFEHLTLALAAMHVGIPYAPISTAYSLVSTDFAKLRGIVDLLTPGLVYASSAERYGDAIRACCSHGTEIVLGDGGIEGWHPTHFEQLLALAPDAQVEEAHQAIGGDTIAKFLFTSGSTKAPKGVITTHRMMCSNQQVLVQTLPCLAEQPPVLVDWLPWNHVFGGSHNVGLVIYNGGSLYIDDGKPVPRLIEQTLANLREISPTIYFNVPRGFEEIVGVLDTDPELRKRFFADVQIFFSAGAGMPADVAQALERASRAECGQSVGLYSGLGMTETAPFALGPARVGGVPGAIGCPAPGITLKLVPNDDKIEVRYAGPGVTPGYWRAPQQTAEAFDDEGYFISGDAIRFVDAEQPEHGFVFDGRVAEDFKLNTGTWVSVGPLRTRSLTEGSPCVMDVIITGHDRDQLGMLIFPRLDACARLSGLAVGTATAAILSSEPVQEFFQRFVDRMYALGTGTSSRVARALVMHEIPAIDKGEVTDKGSLNQRAVLASRAALVAELYAGSPAVIIANKD